MPNWHITLAFLGNVSAATKACVVAEASLVKGQSFGLKLDELGFFKRASIVWLGTKQCPDALIQLVQQLNVRLASCGYQPGFKTYTPHLTLLRKADKSFDLKGVTPIEWSVHDFVLVESVTTNRGATYEVMHRWDLAS